MPVNSLISPARALRYMPFTSRPSQTSNEQRQYTSIKSPSAISRRTRSRSARKGEMNAVSAITPASTNNLAVSPTLRIFSARALSEKPRSPHSPWRTLSPSSTNVRHPIAWSRSSTAWASVDLPDPDSPVNQTTTLRCPLSRCLASRVTKACCHVTFVLFCMATLIDFLEAQAIPYSRHDFSKCDGQGESHIAETDYCDYIHGMHILFICQS